MVMQTETKSEAVRIYALILLMTQPEIEIGIRRAHHRRVLPNLRLIPELAKSRISGASCEMIGIARSASSRPFRPDDGAQFLIQSKGFGTFFGAGSSLLQDERHEFYA